MGIRGFEWAIYIDDDGNRWLLRVDADYFADSDRGWSERTAGDTQIWPQGWRPRVVQGIEADGTIHFARIGALTAPLWTRAVTSFTVNASSELPVSATVIRYLAEQRRPVPPPLP